MDALCGALAIAAVVVICCALRVVVGVIICFAKKPSGYGVADENTQKYLRSINPGGE